MPVELTVQGGEKLGVLAARLKETGNTELRKELFRGIQRAAKPLRAAAANAARENLPKRGGLNEWVASSKFTISIRSGRNPAVRVKGNKQGHDLAAMDRGRLRHPLFGNRKLWFTQQIRAGWFSEAMQRESPGVRREVVNVIDDMARELERL